MDENTKEITMTPKLNSSPKNTETKINNLAWQLSPMK
jgi:hypothetical protein